jgi:hypothetical protein
MGHIIGIEEEIFFEKYNTNVDAQQHMEIASPCPGHSENRAR